MSPYALDSKSTKAASNMYDDLPLSTTLALWNIKIKYVPLCPTQALRLNPCRSVSVLLEYRSLIQQA